MISNVQQIRTAIITSKFIGPFVQWGWRLYITALAISAPKDCAEIPKVPDAGKCFTDQQGGYQLMHNGIKIKLGSYYDDLNKVIIEKLQGHHEPQEELVFYKVLERLPENPVMIEVGSYWGYYSLWFKKEKPSGMVYLIEPLDKHLVAGKENFKVNGMRGEFLKAYAGATSKPPHTLKMEGEIVKDVEKITVDDFMARYKISYVDVLHVDVQGAEFELLKGANTLLDKGNFSYIFLSTHGAQVHDDCLALLAKYGLHIIASHTRAESFTTDGLIVARNGKINGVDEVFISKKKSGIIEDVKMILKYVF